MSDSNTIVGVDFAGPKSTRDQRRKIIAVAARATGWRRYRIDAYGMNKRLLTKEYPGATLRVMGMSGYKSRPDEAIQLSIDACKAAGVTLDVLPEIRGLCCRYNSGGKRPDHDAADAFVALCTAILYAEGACRASVDARSLQAQSEGLIWVPAHRASGHS